MIAMKYFATNQLIEIIVISFKLFLLIVISTNCILMRWFVNVIKMLYCEI